MHSYSVLFENKKESNIPDHEKKILRFSANLECLPVLTGCVFFSLFPTVSCRSFVKISMTTSKSNVYFLVHILAAKFGMKLFAANVRNTGKNVGNNFHCTYRPCRLDAIFGIAW